MRFCSWCSEADILLENGTFPESSQQAIQMHYEYEGQDFRNLYMKPDLMTSCYSGQAGDLSHLKGACEELPTLVCKERLKPAYVFLKHKLLYSGV